MDLFEDLPEPGGDVQKSEPSLFDNLPDPSSPDVAPHVPDLFGELPEAKNDLKGEKRKLTDQNGSKGHEEKKLCKGFVTLKGYVAERKGEREEMQDAHVIIDDFTLSFTRLPSEISRLSYFAVFDGHGGTRASKYAAQNLHLNLARNFPKGEVNSIEKTIKKCLLMTFKQTDEGFLKQASSQKPAWKDGSTATCVLLVDKDLYVANLGDSRAVLCRMNEASKKLTALPLAKEHNPTQYDERMRIQKAGGTVRFILLACDGLFKVFSPEEAVLFVSAILEDKTLIARPGKAMQDVQFEAACNRLASEAVRRGSADNVTIILVAITH
ncbi:integrin-linked kinase-associated serine/threonine phosphatase 2C isoform X3 [Cetorhinus maximus]